jgi:phosphate uptake regulator
MYKELIALFKKDSLLDKAYRQSYEMLDLTFKMYKEIRRLLREEDNSDFSFDIRDKDIAVNRYEREVRRNVFNHLSVAGVENLNSGLVLISIIIDIERIGDYTKNMVELAEWHQLPLSGGKNEKNLKKIESAVEDAFPLVRKCFEKGDEKLAEEILTDYQWISKMCDEHVTNYLNEKDKSISSGDAVALTLYFRYLKRINSHLRNIATCFVNPFYRIGFSTKKKK